MPLTEEQKQLAGEIFSFVKAKAIKENIPGLVSDEQIQANISNYLQRKFFTSLPVIDSSFFLKPKRSSLPRYFWYLFLSNPLALEILQLPLLRDQMGYVEDWKVINQLNERLLDPYRIDLASLMSWIEKFFIPRPAEEHPRFYQFIADVELLGRIGRAHKFFNSRTSFKALTDPQKRLLKSVEALRFAKDSDLKPEELLDREMTEAGVAFLESPQARLFIKTKEEYIQALRLPKANPVALIFLSNVESPAVTHLVRIGEVWADRRLENSFLKLFESLTGEGVVALENPEVIDWILREGPEALDSVARLDEAQFFLLMNPHFFAAFQRVARTGVASKIKLFFGQKADTQKITEFGCAALIDAKILALAKTDLDLFYLSIIDEDTLKILRTPEVLALLQRAMDEGWVPCLSVVLQAINIKDSPVKKILETPSLLALVRGREDGVLLGGARESLLHLYLPNLTDPVISRLKILGLTLADFLSDVALPWVLKDDLLFKYLSGRAEDFRRLFFLKHRPSLCEALWSEWLSNFLITHKIDLKKVNHEALDTLGSRLIQRYIKTPEDFYAVAKLSGLACEHVLAQVVSGAFGEAAAAKPSISFAEFVEFVAKKHAESTNVSAPGGSPFWQSPVLADAKPTETSAANLEPSVVEASSDGEAGKTGGCQVRFAV